MNKTLATELLLRIPKGRSTSWAEMLVAVNVEVAESETFYWVRCASHDDRAQATLMRLPGQRFRSDDSGRLTERGKRVASERLPELHWKRIDECVELSLPVPALAGNQESIESATLCLARSSGEASAAGGLYRPADLQAWASNVSAVRLQGLQSAIVNVGDSVPSVLVVGEPLPALRCQYLWRNGPVFLPLGFSWSPEVPASTIATIFNLAKNELLLWLASGYLPLGPGSLQPLTRAQIRSIV